MRWPGSREAAGDERMDEKRNEVGRKLFRLISFFVHPFITRPAKPDNRANRHFLSVPPSLRVSV
jgi:hypothetical protein